MKKRHLFLSVVMLGVFIHPWASFSTPINGLTVALSLDGQTLIASGSNRSFFRLHPETLEVMDRIWHGYSITAMAFNRDGTRLAVTDAGTGGLVTIFDVATLQRLFEVRGRDIVAFCSAADLFAGVEGHRSTAPFLNVHHMSDGETVLRIPLLPRRPVTATALNTEATLVAILYEGENDPEAERSTPEAGLQGFDRVIATHLGDGRTSIVEFYDLVEGDLIARHTLFYSLNRAARAVILNGDMVVVAANDQNAIIGQDGTVQMFQTASSMNYGMGFSSDHRTIMTGGLAQMAITPASGETSTGFPVLSRLPSWPEYFRGFAGNAEGALYGATDGYRLFEMHRNGSVLREVSVY